MHLADVNFDDGAFKCVQRVENRDGVMRQRTRVDDDCRCLLACFMDPVDDLTFIVRLKQLHVEASSFCDGRAVRFNVFQSVVAVNFRLAFAQKV